MAGLSDLDQLRSLGYRVGSHPFGRMVDGNGRSWVARDDAEADAVITQVTNHAAQVQKLHDAVDFFSGNFANWATMTNAQKDTAMRQSQRALANLARYVLDDMTSGGD